MTRTIVDIHILQTVPPSNINRDDTGSPKTAVFGGVVRSRVSSQAWKRATRLAFPALLDDSDLGMRTKRAVELVTDRIAERRPDLAASAPALAEQVLAKGCGIQTEKKKRGAKDDDPGVEVQETKYLVFLSNLQLDLLAEAAVELAGADDEVEKIKEIKARKLLSRGHSVDLALFGRMVADSTDLNVDAAAQVAHAVSVHRVDNEFDYFTAVDDAKGDDEQDSGAGMIGTVEFNSSTLYRYATVDVDRLQDNLGDAEATRRAVEAFVTAFVQSMPTGKQNTFANGTLPDAVLVQVRDTQSVNLVGAFEDPVTADRDRTRVEVAAALLARRSAEMADTFGQVPVASWSVAVGPARAGLADVEGFSAEAITLPVLAPAVGELVAQRLGAS